MTDLVQRLHGWMDRHPMLPATKLMHEAADRIEKLEAALRQIESSAEWGDEYAAGIARRALEEST